MRDLLYSPFRQSFTIISFQDTFLNLLIKDVQVAASGKSRTHLNSYYAALALYHRFYDPLCMKKDYHRISIKDLYPNLSEEELRTAEENLDQYLEHEGWDPPESAKVELSGLLNTVSALLSGPKFKFPSANPGNALMTPEQWGQQIE